MSVETELCRAFCDSIKVAEVPLGLAVSTGFSREDGDAVGFYIVRNSENDGLAHLEDDGETVPFVEANGVDILTDGPRADAFQGLLEEYGADFNSEEFVLRTADMPVEQIPDVALRFTALLLRIQDFLLISHQRVEHTFKADVLNAIGEKFSARTRIETDYIFNDDLQDYPVDVALIDQEHSPLAVFIGTSENKALEALLFHHQTTYANPFSCKVMLILDNVATRKVTPRTLNRAVNDLSVAAFKGERESAMRNVERQLFGEPTQSLH